MNRGTRRIEPGRVLLRRFQRKRTFLDEDDPVWIPCLVVSVKRINARRHASLRPGHGVWALTVRWLQEPPNTHDGHRWLNDVTVSDSDLRLRIEWRRGW